MDMIKKTLKGVVTSGSASGRQMSVEFQWQRRHPLMVHAAYSVPGAGSWIIGRDLLADGLHGKSGEGSVTVAPGPRGSGLLLTVRGAGESLTVLFPGGITDMEFFLAATYQEVPRHHDIAADLDRELAKIFKEAA